MMIDIDTLLAEIAPLAKMDRDAAAENAPQFQALSFFSPGEVISTKILSYLLNPHAPHAQGYVFFQAFLDAVNDALDTELIDLGGKQPQCVDVRANAPCDTETCRRQMDLQILFTVGEIKYAVVVESKSHGAPDQENQVRDYLEYIRKAFHDRRKFFLYLKEGEQPCEKSIPRHEWEKAHNEGICYALAYRDVMRSWLTRSRGNRMAKKLRLFLEDFAIFAGLQEEGAMTMAAGTKAGKRIEEIIALGPGDPSADSDGFEALLAIYELHDEIWIQAVRAFVEQTGRAIKEFMPEWNVLRPDCEFKDGTSSFCLGISPPSEDQRNPSVAVYLESELGGPGRAGELKRFTLYVQKGADLPDVPEFRFNLPQRQMWIGPGREAFVKLYELPLAVRTMLNFQAANEIAARIRDFALEQQPRISKYVEALRIHRSRSAE
jgi:hypothetical protein